MHSFIASAPPPHLAEVTESLAREVEFQPSRPLLPSPANTVVHMNQRCKRYPCVNRKPKVLESKSDILRHAQLEQGGHASVKWTWEAGHLIVSHKLQAKLVTQQDPCIIC